MSRQPLPCAVLARALPREHPDCPRPRDGDPYHLGAVVEIPARLLLERVDRVLPAGDLHGEDRSGSWEAAGQREHVGPAPHGGR